MLTRYSRAAALGLIIALAPTFGFSQGVPEPSREATIAAQSVIEGLVAISRAEEVFADARRTLKDVYIPVFRDAIQGDLSGTPAPDRKTADTMAKALTVLDYARKAGDELDAAITENRAAMISEAAALLAQSVTGSELKDMAEVLALPAVRKGFDTVYAATRLVTGFSYDETRTLSEFSAWTANLAINLDFSNGIPGTPGSGTPPPSQRKLTKSQALLNDITKLSRLDEMSAQSLRFLREVYLPTANLAEEERAQLKAQVDQWEFAYNFQKSLVISVAPFALAASLSDEQLAIIHTFVRSPAFARIFHLLQNVIAVGTSFSADEIVTAQKFFDALDDKSKADQRSPDETEKYAERWTAFGKKWGDILVSRISPDVLNGLKRSLAAMQEAEKAQ